MAHPLIVIHKAQCISNPASADYFINIKKNRSGYDRHILQGDVARPNLEALHYDLTNNQDYFQDMITIIWRARLILYRGKNK